MHDFKYQYISYVLDYGEENKPRWIEVFSKGKYNDYVMSIPENFK